MPARPTHYILRAGPTTKLPSGLVIQQPGRFVPLIALDQLPEWLDIVNVPRQLSLHDAAEMQMVAVGGTAQPSTVQEEDIYDVRIIYHEFRRELQRRGAREEREEALKKSQSSGEQSRSAGETTPPTTSTASTPSPPPPPTTEPLSAEASSTEPPSTEPPPTEPLPTEPRPPSTEPLPKEPLPPKPSLPLHWDTRRVADDAESLSRDTDESTERTSCASSVISSVKNSIHGSHSNHSIHSVHSNGSRDTNGDDDARTVATTLSPRPTSGAPPARPTPSPDSVLPRAIRRTRKPKVYCRHWCAKGTCKYGEECFYIHEMPTTADELESAGLTELPQWWLKKQTSSGRVRVSSRTIDSDRESEKASKSAGKRVRTKKGKSEKSETSVRSERSERSERSDRADRRVRETATAARQSPAASDLTDIYESDMEWNVPMHEITIEPVTSPMSILALSNHFTAKEATRQSYMKDLEALDM